MREVTGWFVLVGPLAVLLVDALVWWLWGYQATITAVVRSWAAVSPWPEAAYLAAAYVLHGHLFRGWL